MEILEPAGGINLARKITNKDFVAVIKATAQEAYDKLSKNNGPEALNLTEDGDVLNAEEAEKYVTESGSWKLPNKKESKEPLTRKTSSKKGGK